MTTENNIEDDNMSKNKVLTFYILRSKNGGHKWKAYLNILSNIQNHRKQQQQNNIHN